MAWLIDKDAVTNSFTPSEVTCQVVEEFENGVSTEKTGVVIENTGDASAYIRAAIVVNWVDEKGGIAAEAPVLGDEVVSRMLV